MEKWTKLSPHFIVPLNMKRPMETWTKSTFLANFSRKFIFFDLVHFSFVPFISRSTLLEKTSGI